MGVTKRGLTSDAVLEAAIDIVDQEGLDALTMASLAKRLEVKSPSLYNHISGIEGVKEKLQERGLQILYRRLSDALIGIAGDEAVFAFARTYLSFARDNPGLYESTLKAPVESPKEIQRLAEDTVQLIQKVLQAYHLDETSSIHAVRGLRSLLHGFAALEYRSAFALSYDLEESVQFNIRLFIEGLKGKE